MSESENSYVLYKDRPEWADVTPIHQDDGEFSVVAIAYSERFRDTYDYFRAVLKSLEKSERALESTQDALELNPSNYTVWQYRRTIIKHLNKDLKEELAYTENMMTNSEKNYQVWHHRRVIVEWAQDPSEEDRVTTLFLSMDPKNYHAWQHRQWYIRTFKLYEGELEFVEQLLSEDVRNNSAWNQRYFVINNNTSMSHEVLLSEVEFTLKNINKVRGNESAWNYLRGIMFHVKNTSPINERVRNFCEDLYSSGERNPYLLGYMVDMCDEALDNHVELDCLSPERARQLCQLLANEFDKIRCRYWDYVARSIEAKAAAVPQIVRSEV